MKFRDLLPWSRKSMTSEQIWLEIYGSKTSKSGRKVDLAAAFRVSAALACIRAIGTGTAAAPLKLFQDYEDAGLQRKRVARDHDIYDVLTAKPNGWQTGFELRETLAMHAAMGNGYVYKGKIGESTRELILLDPSRVEAKMSDGWEPTYTVTGKDGQKREVPAENIWHVRGPSWDGFLGMNLLDAAREALGLSIALEESQSKLHANGVRPSGLYSMEGTLNSEQKKSLTAWLKTQAAADFGIPMILDRGAKWSQMSMTGLDAQAKEVRDQQIEEVCRFLGVLPIIIGHTGDKANTYASAESMFAAHRVQCLAPWWTRIQESADINLLSDKDRKAGYYFKHVANALMLASAKDQAEYFAKALGSGGAPAWMTQDEVRALIEYDPMGGEAAKLPIATNVPKPPPESGPTP